MKTTAAHLLFLFVFNWVTRVVFINLFTFLTCEALKKSVDVSGIGTSLAVLRSLDIISAQVACHNNCEKESEWEAVFKLDWLAFHF